MVAPKSPDPLATAQVQGQMNKDTAVAQAELNQVNQSTPWGGVQYIQTGKNPDGTPQFTATSTYAPSVQEPINKLLKSINTQGTPDFSDPTVTNKIMGLGETYQQPIFDRQKATMEANLKNQGIVPGTEAYDRAMENFGRTTNDYYTNLLMTGRGEAMNEIQAQSNAPYNLLNSLRSGTSPNYAPTTQTQIQPPNYQGLVQTNYQNQLANQQAMMGGLFGIPTAALGGWARGGFAFPGVG